jgi:hypothetical protein
MSNDKQVIDDLVILGMSCPDELHDGRKTVCTAGYSSKLGFIRIYPVPTWAGLSRWDIVQVPLEKNPADVRDESWKIEGSKSQWNELHKKIKRVDKLDRKVAISILEKNVVDCVSTLNENHISLGIIKPTSMEPYFSKRDTYDGSVQVTLDSETLFRTIHNYKVQPRIKYRCSGCKLTNPHDQQIIEWGVYEWLRNNENEMDQVWENLHINDPLWTHYFLVGNQVRHLTSYMIISDFRFKIK